MIDYWMTLDIFQKVLTVIAVPASIVLVVEFVRIIVLSGKKRAGNVQDAPADKKKAAGPCINGSPLITIRGLCAFLAIGAWAGVLSVNFGCADWVGGIIALAAGAVAAVLMALAFNLD